MIGVGGGGGGGGGGGSKMEYYHLVKVCDVPSRVIKDRGANTPSITLQNKGNDMIKYKMITM